ncbi:synaptic vesicle glycoprotein 2B-like [Pectinophora gossypiella]|uniref:synaptic vesicle glycoprotein 2B-like n=1 Tax=Pectinophora gossypiella TaxID=13191 RepID=UPI00214EF807|nr:synaptic vesicle glycoprotein 2B-like [Pectinophora gossypiella]
MKSNSEDTQHTTDSSENVENPMQMLEDALVICKFGRFNIQLMITTLLSVLATTSVTTATSYVLPSAECDLNMTMMQKGLLNAIPFLGQFCACPFTGFITDAFGRKIFLVGGNFGLFVCALFGASSQTYGMLLFAKLLEGVVMSLVFTATATMVTEFTHKLVRDKVLVGYAAFMSISIIITSLIAWAILPMALQFVVIEGYIEIHSWNIYLCVSAGWGLLAAIMYWNLPESPKFLLSHGQEKEALQVLQRIYHVNTGKDEDTFTIKSLNVSGVLKPTKEVSVSKQITNALFETKELFRAPLLCKLILFSTITFVALLAYSALRLWYPQLSTIIENHQKEHNGQTYRFCDMIDSYTSAHNTQNNMISSDNITTPPGDCVPQLAGAQTYTNGIILGFVSLVCISISGYLVDFFGQKPLMFGFLLLCAVCSSVLYWTNSSIQIAILISATCGFMQTAFSLQHNILVRVFPTTVRTMALSIVIMVGRAGSLLGNLLFPLMMAIGCMVPFLTLSTVTLCVAGLIYFLPNPQKENSATGDK